MQRTWSFDSKHGNKLSIANNRILHFIFSIYALLCRCLINISTRIPQTPPNAQPTVCLRKFGESLGRVDVLKLDISRESVKKLQKMQMWHKFYVSKQFTTTHVGLTHWGQVTHISVSKLTCIGSNNGMSPGRRQAIIWTNAGISLIRP